MLDRGDHATLDQLDARRLLCPLPVIRTQARVATLQPGDLLEVIATDPGVRHDLPAWCRVHGHQLIEIVEQEREIHVTLEVGG
ncbi:MAG TPA: sulfurtransferase TusA family protein [Pseudomonadales bacterium]|nr:sulfurtransferase TusA family protein [Pseudomonadales bacterium]